MRWEEESRQAACFAASLTGAKCGGVSVAWGSLPRRQLLGGVKAVGVPDGCWCCGRLAPRAAHTQSQLCCTSKANQSSGRGANQLPRALTDALAFSLPMRPWTCSPDRSWAAWLCGKAPGVPAAHCNHRFNVPAAQAGAAPWRYGGGPFSLPSCHISARTPGHIPSHFFLQS